MMKRKLTAALLATTCLLGGCSVVVEEPAQTTTQETAFDVDNIRPQDDFYGYVNASYLYNLDVNPVTGSAGSFDVCEEEVEARLLAILSDVVNGDRSTYEEGSSRQIIYDAYQQIKYSKMDASSKSLTKLKDEINKIDGIQSIDELIDEYSVLINEYGVMPYYSVKVEIDPQDSSEYLPVIDIYTGLDDLKEIKKGGVTARLLKEDITKVLCDIGVDEEEAINRAEAIVYFQIDIASYTDLDLMKRSDNDPFGIYYQIITIDELDELLPNMGAQSIFDIYDIDKNLVSTIGLYDAQQLTYMDSCFTEDNLQILKDIAIYKVMEFYGSYMTINENSGSVLPDDSILQIMMGTLADPFSQLYAEYYYDQQLVNEVTAMTNSIIEEYVVLVNDSYMSAEGKAAIINKLNNLKICIGAREDYPIADREYVGEDALDTLIINQSANVQEIKKTIGTPVDIENESWKMPSFAVNAVYFPSVNAIEIPLAIMLPPFYDPNASVGTNYGALGVVIGHEISHAFDSSGMMYDANGNYCPEWIPEEDKAIFDANNQVLIEYFSSLTFNDVYHVNGEQTLGENLADIGSMQCILKLLTSTSDKKDMFESYARIWASVIPVDAALSALESDEHSPDMIRCNAVVALFDEFYEIYDVNEGDKMFVAPENRIKRW